MTNNLVSIDPHNLEQEWTDQPGAVHWVNIRWAEALRDRKAADADVERVMAEMDERIRGQLDKPTETMIKRHILTSPIYQKAVKQRDDLAHEQHLIEAERYALDHKKAALENLVRLRLSDWYSEPKSHKQREKETDDNAEEHRKSLNKPKRKKPQRI